MAFFSKIFSGTNGSTNSFSDNKNLLTAKKSTPMRKLAVVVEDEEVLKTEKEKNDQKKKIIVQEEQTKSKKKQRAADDPLLKLKALAEKIRNRVHYIDKNDFAKRAVSSKDKVYDFDLRKDLAYFLANDEFLTEVEVGIKTEKTADDFQRFETLIANATKDEEIGYVVYGDKTYVIGKEVEKEEQSKKPGKNQTAKVEKEKTVAGLSLQIVGVFSKSATDFMENLKKEAAGDADVMITQSEKNILIRIFTKRFLRELIAEKETEMKEKMAFKSENSEELVEFVCSSIFK
ncbi:MAG: hypothetical protein WCF93_04285 [Candidatus Moraniibacteriota bacterium]